MSQTVDLKMYDSFARVGRLITRIYMEVMDALEQDLSQYDVSAAQYIVISLIAKGEAESASQICRELSYNPGAMTRMLDRLEKKDLIRRVPLPHDRRTVRLELTAQGQALYPNLFACSAAVLARYYGRCSVDELEQLRFMLQRILPGEKQGA